MEDTAIPYELPEVVNEWQVTHCNLSQQAMWH